MNLDQLTQGALAVAKAAAFSVPFTAIVNRVLGPAADEYAEQLRDKRRLYRFENELKGWRKAVQMISDAGLRAKSVPPKILFPLLDGLGLEEDENLHTMWAALLANASNPDTPDLVHPSFAGLLKQLSPADAKLLERLYAPLPANWHLSERKFHERPFVLDAVEVSQEIEVSTLEALSLIIVRDDMVDMPRILRGDTRPFHTFTARGIAFMQACQAPRKRPD